MILLISPSKILDGDVLKGLSDYYRLELDHYYDYDEFRVVRKVAGEEKHYMNTLIDLCRKSLN